MAENHRGLRDLFKKWGLASDQKPGVRRSSLNESGVKILDQSQESRKGDSQQVNSEAKTGKYIEDHLQLLQILKKITEMEEKNVQHRATKHAHECNEELTSVQKIYNDRKTTLEKCQEDIAFLSANISSIMVALQQPVIKEGIPVPLHLQKQLVSSMKYMVEFFNNLLENVQLLDQSRRPQWASLPRILHNNFEEVKLTLAQMTHYVHQLSTCADNLEQVVTSLVSGG